MVIDVIIVVIIAIIAGLFGNAVVKENNRNSNKMSFRETMDLVDLPIITFKQGNNKLNFLLDTGASSSVINKSSLEFIDYKSTDKKNYVYGSEGNKFVEEFIEMVISYKDKEYTEEFIQSDLDKAFDNLKKDFGVNLVGILGNSFFQKYKYIIDFKEFAAYSTK